MARPFTYKQLSRAKEPHLKLSPELTRIFSSAISQQKTQLGKSKMKNLLWICAALMTMFVAGEALICNSCRVGLGPKCLFKSTETCSDPQYSCYTGKVDFSISEWMTLRSQGCLSSSLCNQTTSGSLLGANYTITKNCCCTDLCNGASSAQLPLTAALGTALTAGLSLWAL